MSLLDGANPGYFGSDCGNLRGESCRSGSIDTEISSVDVSNGMGEEGSLNGLLSALLSFNPIC